MFKVREMWNPFGSVQFIRQIKIVPFSDNMLPHFEAVLQHHGARIETHAEHVILHVPDGTTWQEAFPRTVDIRALIVFPDSYTLKQIQRRNTDVSIINFPPDGLPSEIVAQLRAQNE